MTSATVLTPALSSPARVPGKYDRLFYSTSAIVLALTVFAGFSSSYYLPLFAGGPSTTFSGAPFTTLVHAHGALFTAWVLLFVVQTALVAARRVTMHRRLGVAGAVLAAAMVVVGMSTALTGAARGSAPPGVDPLVFLVVPFFDVVLFATFFTIALLLRRNKEAHKRLMLLAYVSIVVAAVARLPGVLQLGPLGFFGLTFLFVVAGAAYDLWSRGRIHRVYLWGGALFAVAAPGRLVISGTSAWRSFAELLTQ